MVSKKHPLFWLGLLGLLGLLSLITKNIGFAGFFGFFGFFGFAKVKNDERLETSINRAARNAFMISVVAYAIGMIVLPLVESTELFIIAFPAVFVLQLLVFTFSFSYYDQMGN
ncbi:MAG: DUF3796 domain-containing protein [Methylocystaceae bacterium]